MAPRTSLTRRGFFGAASAAAAALAAPRSAFGSALAAPDAALPQPIAALSNLSGQARPFSVEERLARIEHAKKLMHAARMEAIVLANSTASSFYFANLRFGSSERLWALVLPARSTPFLVCPAFEEGRARELLAAGPLAAHADVLTWQEDESPYELLGKGLSDRGLKTAAIGIDEEMKFVFSDGIRAANPHLSLVSATPVTAGCRMVKDAHEIECMRLACRATLLVYRAVAQSLTPGMTTGDVEALIAQAYRRVGFRGDASLNVDEYTALPHGSPTPQTLREGSILMLDDGCRVEGYTSDITRTFVLGRPTAKMNAVFDIIHRAQSAALVTARPGVPAADVDAAARKVIVSSGYGPGFTYFTHRLGHGIGLDMHEWPYALKNNMFGWDLAPRLKAGMVLSDEPGIYIQGQFGIRLEDDMLVTEDGAQLFTLQSPSLEDPFGNMDS
ncbi:MAG TPA: Xaa-Pro peptidase family protein [Terracidiphilus sp.]|nr:Xaa-Pro peptidase family protein [Terracidiphilus sp.]